MATDARRRWVQGGGQQLMAASAFSFGVFGWLLAHLVTYGLVGHWHAGDPGVQHVHSYVPAVALFIGCIAGGLLLVIFVEALRRSEGLGTWPRQPLRSAVSRSSLLAAASFVVAEFAKHALTGQSQIPPAVVLIVGSAAQALIGVGMSLLWRRCVRGVVRLAVRLRGGVVVGSCPPRLPPVLYKASQCRNRWAVAYAGRAPPAATT